jgi:uncharacterized membrane protein
MDQNIGIATLAITQGIAQFNVFLPRLSDVRKAAPGDDISADVHVGEIAAIAGTVGIGLITSSLVGSKLPLIVSLIVAALMVSVYESVLRCPAERFAF